jgi:hypothetical protein
MLCQDHYELRKQVEAQEARLKALEAAYLGLAQRLGMGGLK